MQVQPIFILSVADALLSVLWISGSLVWLRGGLHHLDDLRASCFSITLLTVVSIRKKDSFWDTSVVMQTLSITFLQSVDTTVRSDEPNSHICSIGIFQYQEE
jgi:hypothetical protein